MGVDGSHEVIFGAGSAAGTAAAVDEEVSLAAEVVSTAGTCTRAEWPVDEVVGGGAVTVSVVVASVSTAAAAGALLALATDEARALTFPPDVVTARWRAECAVAFFADVESLEADAVELFSELFVDALSAPDPAPVSAYATADPLARAAPRPRVTVPATSQA